MMMGGRKERTIRVKVKKWVGREGGAKGEHLETVTFRAGDKGVDLEDYLGEGGTIPCFNCEFRHRVKSYSTRYRGPRDREGYWNVISVPF